MKRQVNAQYRNDSDGESFSSSRKGSVNKLIKNDLFIYLKKTNTIIDLLLTLDSQHMMIVGKFKKLDL